MHLQVCGKSHIRAIIFHEGLFSPLISVSKIPYSCHSQASFIWKIEDHCNLHQHVPSSPASLTNTVHTGYSGASLLFVYAVTRATVVSPHPGESSWRQGRAESGDGCQDRLPLHHKQKQWSLNPLRSHHIYKIPRISIIWGVKVKRIKMITRSFAIKKDHVKQD